MVVCLTAVAALSAPGSALAAPKSSAPVALELAPVVEVVEPTATTESSFAWLANWTW